MTSSLPFISVIVPARDRPAALSALLSALADQSYPPGQFEVLICDDGSAPPLAELVPARQGALTVRYLRGEQGGPAVARNRGIRQARGSVLAFTDDDCLPDAGWLEGIAEAFGTQGCVACHGPTRSSVPPLEGIVHSVHAVKPEDGVATANFAVLRTALQAVGGFDETFRSPYFEDEDLARRIEAMLGPIAWSEDVRVEHPPRQSGFASAWRGAGHWRWLPYMERLHPGVREGAMRGVRLRVAAKSALVLLGLAPLVGAPPSFGLGLVALAAWQVRRLRRVLGVALAHGWRVPVGTQLAYVAGEWLLDFRRWAAYVEGRGVERVDTSEVEAELGF